MAEDDVEEDVKIQKGSLGYIKDIDGALSALFPPNISALGFQASPKRSQVDLGRETHRATRAVCNHSLSLGNVSSSPVGVDR